MQCRCFVVHAHLLPRDGPVSRAVSLHASAANRDLTIRPSTLPLNLLAHCRAPPVAPRTVVVASVGLDWSGAPSRACESARAGLVRVDRDTGLERIEVLALREMRCPMSGHLGRRSVTRPVFETRPWRPRFGMSDRRPSSLALRLALIPATAGLDFLPLPASPSFLAEDKKVAPWLPSTACRPLRGAGRAPPVCRQPSRSR